MLYFMFGRSGPKGSGWRRQAETGSIRAQALKGLGSQDVHEGFKKCGLPLWAVVLLLVGLLRYRLYINGQTSFTAKI